MKSYDDYALTMIRCILMDAAARWPELRVSLDKDLIRLRRDVESRGLSFLTIVLPDLNKVLDKNLDSGQESIGANFYPQGVKLTRGRPLLLRGLRDLVFDELGCLRTEASHEAVFYLRQIHLAAKKYRIPCADDKMKGALDEFFSIESYLPASHVDTWDAERPIWQPRYGHPLWGTSERASSTLFEGCKVAPFWADHHAWDGFRHLCLRVIQRMQYPEWSDLRPRHGPGVVSEGPVRKYSFPHWPRKLEEWFPFDFYGSGKLDATSRPSDREPSSRLIAVPKTQKSPRLICAEPTAHQWMQQAVWQWMREEIRYSVLRLSIDFSSQENSRERALHSSHSLAYATIDLSSASDRLSTRLVEYVFQGHPILDAMHACRTRSLTQTISADHPSMIVLRKFAPMGSALTFPVQSVVYALIAAYAVILVDELDAQTTRLEDVFREITVFGDDIIVPIRAVDHAIGLLTECGLKVNSAKTFKGVAFRESCGMDAFRGYDVTPAYTYGPYDGSPESTASTVECSNNFHMKGMWRTADYMLGQIPEQERKLLAVQNWQIAGSLPLRSFSAGISDHLKFKWDRDLQRHYVECLTVNSKVDKTQEEGYENLTQYFTERPSPDVIWSSGEVTRVRLRKGRTRIYQ